MEKDLELVAVLATVLVPTLLLAQAKELGHLELALAILLLSAMVVESVVVKAQLSVASALVCFDNQASNMCRIFDTFHRLDIYQCSNVLVFHMNIHDVRRR